MSKCFLIENWTNCFLIQICHTRKRDVCIVYVRVNYLIRFVFGSVLLLTEYISKTYTCVWKKLYETRPRPFMLTKWIFRNGLQLLEIYYGVTIDFAINWVHLQVNRSGMFAIQFCLLIYTIAFILSSLHTSINSYLKTCLVLHITCWCSLDNQWQLGLVKY